MSTQTIPNLDDPALQPFTQKLSGEWALVLLQEGTCTYRAGKRFAEVAFGEEPKILEVSSFQQAIEESQAPNRVLLLPHLAIPHVANMETDPNRVTLHDLTFRYSNPPLYLAGCSADAKGTCAAIVHLHNLSSLEDGITQWKQVSNTQEAAEACAKREADLCITNEHGLKKFNLVPVRELKRMQPTWFVYRWKT